MKMTLPAMEFSRAWLNTSLASGKDRGRPQLFRTVLVEVFGDRTVQLVAADGSMLMVTACSTVADLDALNGPSIDEVPDESYVVIDPDGRMRTLMGWALRDAKTAEKDGTELEPVSVEVRSAESPLFPTLAPELDRRVLVVTTERERIECDLYDGPFVSWRPLLAGHQPAPTGNVMFASALLARFAKLRDADGFVEFNLGGSDGAVRFSVDAEPPVHGVLMPVAVAPQNSDDEDLGDES